jgi:CDP-glucose 4,6-dehydratase
MISNYYKGKKVMITGHNGFKGAWLTKWLIDLGALVSGVSLPNRNEDSMFNILNLGLNVSHYEFDIRDFEQLERTLEFEAPEIIFHLAAQPLVIESYLNPHYTHSVNYFGTLNLLESIRIGNFCKKLIVITSDKVYEPRTDKVSLNENSILGGYDPYSGSKSAVELLVQSYRESYFNKQGIQCLTARAGNVVGFGDWAKDRLFADIFKNVISNKEINIRNPHAIRPWQDVNDLCYGYLLLAMNSDNLVKDNLYSINFGPDNSNYSVQDLLDIVKIHYPDLIVNYDDSDYVETNYLLLDSSLANVRLGWTSTKTISASIEITIRLLNHHLDLNKDKLTKDIESLIQDYI